MVQTLCIFSSEVNLRRIISLNDSKCQPNKRVWQVRKTKIEGEGGAMFVFSGMCLYSTIFQGYINKFFQNNVYFIYL